MFFAGSHSLPQPMKDAVSLSSDLRTSSLNTSTPLVTLSRIMVSNTICMLPTPQLTGPAQIPPLNCRFRQPTVIRHPCLNFNRHLKLDMSKRESVHPWSCPPWLMASPSFQLLRWKPQGYPWLLSFSHILHQICQEILLVPSNKHKMWPLQSMPSFFSSFLADFPILTLAMIHSHLGMRMSQMSLLSLLCSPPSSGSPLLTQSNNRVLPMASDLCYMV